MSEARRRHPPHNRRAVRCTGSTRPTADSLEKPVEAAVPRHRPSELKGYFAVRSTHPPVQRARRSQRPGSLASTVCGRIRPLESTGPLHRHPDSRPRSRTSVRRIPCRSSRECLLRRVYLRWSRSSSGLERFPALQGHQPDGSRARDVRHSIVGDCEVRRANATDSRKSRTLNLTNFVQESTKSTYGGVKHKTVVRLEF